MYRLIVVHVIISERIFRQVQAYLLNRHEVRC